MQSFFKKCIISTINSSAVDKKGNGVKSPSSSLYCKKDERQKSLGIPGKAPSRKISSQETCREDKQKTFGEEC